MLTVHVSTKLNRSHLVHGKEAIILPCLARTDKDIIDGVNQFVSCENSMSVVQASAGVLKPISKNLFSEVVIVCRLARATLGTGSKINWDKYANHYDSIRDAIERTIPGFDNYNVRVRIAGGFYLPNCNRDGAFNTAVGKAHFNVAGITVPKLEDDELMMMTIRSHDQFNTTIYGLNDRYRGIYNERRVIFMNQRDMNDLGLQEGDLVDLYNNSGGRERVARQFVPIPILFPENVLLHTFRKQMCWCPLPVLLIRAILQLQRW